MDIKKISPLVEKVFEFLFPNLNYEIVLGEKIIIKIKNVNPSPIYNPSNFDAEYRMFEKDDETISSYTRFDFFYSLYAYIPDCVKHIIIELHPYPFSSLIFDVNSPCQVFDLFNDYIIEEKKIKTPNSSGYNNIYQL